MSTPKTRRHYLLPVISTLIVLSGIALLVEADLDITAGQVLIVTLLYFTANIVYGLSNQELTTAKVIELGLVSGLIGYIALSYLV